MSCISFQYNQSIKKVCFIKLYSMLILIIISQNNLIRNTSQYTRNILSRIIKNILTIFSSLFFNTSSKMLNMIEFEMIFWIINHNMILSIG